METKYCDKCKERVDSKFNVVMGHSCLEDSNEVQSLEAKIARLNDEAQHHEEKAKRLRKKALEGKEELEKLKADTKTKKQKKAF